MAPPASARRRRRRVAERDRKRAPRACRRCKSRKNKCIETPSGICQRCLDGSHQCIFDRSRSPIQGDESVPVEHNDRPEFERDTDSATATHLSHSPAQLPESPSNDILVDIFTSERSTWQGFLSRLREAFSLDPPPSMREQEVVRAQLPSAQRHPPSLEEQQRLRKAVAAFPPLDVARFLVSVCIDHGTDSFFYFDQRQFIREVEQFYTDRSSPLRSDISFVFLALAAFALGSQWTSLEKPEGSEEQLPQASHNPGHIFYTQARGLIPEILDRACIRSIQGIYILAVFLLPSTAIGASYVFTGLALRQALSLGLHQSINDPFISDYEKEIRRRLWCAIYSLERHVLIPCPDTDSVEADSRRLRRTTTIKLNHPRSIDQSLITVELPRRFPQDIRQKFDNVDHQIANAKLVKILDHVSECGLWSIEKAAMFERYEAELKEWKRSLPPSLKLVNVDPKLSSYRAVFHLYLNYYFGWISLGKLSMVTVVRSRLHLASNGSTKQPEFDDAVVVLARSCTKAARKILELFEDVHRTGNMARFSYTDFQGCSIATIILLLAGILERDSWYEARVTFGLSCLRRMAGTVVAPKIGVHLVESLQSIADEAFGKLHRSGDSTTAEQKGPRRGVAHDGDYERWSEWLAGAEVAVVSRGGESHHHYATPDVIGPDSSSLGAVPPDVDMFTPADMQSISLAPVSDLIGDESAVAAGFDIPPVHQPTIPGLPQQTYKPRSTATPGSGLSDYPLEYNELDFSLTSYNDNPMYLMGLTGFDVLDFSNQGQ